MEGGFEEVDEDTVPGEEEAGHVDDLGLVNVDGEEVWGAVSIEVMIGRK